MWYPPQVFVPLYSLRESYRPSNLSTTLPLQTVPFHQPEHVYCTTGESWGYLDRPFVENGRKLQLMKDLFDLVKVSNFLELTDRRLLGWYLSLPPDDRKLIQGEGGFTQLLRSHPALEVSQHIVYVKRHLLGDWPSPSSADMFLHFNGSRHPRFYGALQCSSCGSCTACDKCQYCQNILNQEENICVSDEEKSLQLLPNDVKEELNIFKSETHKGLRNENSRVRVFKDPHVQSKFLTDMEPKRQGLGHSTADVFSVMQKKALPKNYDFSSTRQKCKVKSAAENCTFLVSSPHTCRSCGWTEYAEDNSDHNYSGLETETNKTYNVTDEEASSSAAASCQNPCNQTLIKSSWSTSSCSQCVPEKVSEFKESCLSLGPNKPNMNPSAAQEKCELTPVSLRVSQTVDVSNDFRACFTFTRGTEVSEKFMGKSCTEQGTQTIRTSSSEKNTITEVYMSDLDVLSTEFEKLKMMEEELQHLKDKMTRGQGQDFLMSERGGDAVQRARRAELHLLALQYIMCQQHFWRRYYTSPLGESALQGTGMLPNAMLQTLKKLENDFKEKKKMILLGVPLENLEPLSVDLQGILSGTCYNPSLTYEAYLKDLMLDPSHSPQPDQTSKGFKMETTFGGLLGSPTTLPKVSHFVHENINRAAIASEQQVNPKEIIGNEAWFDAEEELGLTGEDCAEEKPSGQRRDRKESQTEQKGDANEKHDQSYLCVIGLPRNITKHDLLLWFERYHAREVCISDSNRAAIVTVRSSKDAEAAVREVNKQCMQGHILHVERIHRSAACGLGPIKESCPELSLMGHKAGPVMDEARTRGSEINPYTLRPLPGNLDKLTKVCDTPTASGTCVPQHNATMGSFDTLMFRLSKRHPNRSREKIVGALLELRAKHQCFLSGQSLQAIEDMTSDFLTQSETKLNSV